MFEAGERWSGAGRDLDLIVNLGDGVFAIAITLLVLDILVPEIPERLVATELPGELLSLWPRYLGYLLSEYRNHQLPVAIYSGTLAIGGLLLTAMY